MPQLMRALKGSQRIPLSPHTRILHNSLTSGWYLPLPTDWLIGSYIMRKFKIIRETCKILWSTAKFTACLQHCRMYRQHSETWPHFTLPLVLIIKILTLLHMTSEWQTEKSQQTKPNWTEQECNVSYWRVGAAIWNCRRLCTDNQRQLLKTSWQFTWMYKKIIKKRLK